MNQDISTMYTEELLSYGKQLQSESDLKGTSQGAKKVLLNSLECMDPSAGMCW